MTPEEWKARAVFLRQHADNMEWRSRQFITEAKTIRDLAAECDAAAEDAGKSG